MGEELELTTEEIYALDEDMSLYEPAEIDDRFVFGVPYPTEHKNEEKSARRKRIAGTIFRNFTLLVVIALGILSVIFITKNIDPAIGNSFVWAIHNIDYACLGELVAAVLCVMLLDTAKFCIISKTVTGKMRPKSCMKASFLGKYYDAVTPFATGGQPMQIHYFMSKGVSGGHASAMTLIRYFSTILCWIIIGAGLMVYGAIVGVLDHVGSSYTGATILNVTGWVGISLNLIVPLFIILCLLLPRVMPRLIGGIIRFGHKLHIVKDVEKTERKTMKVVSDFRNSFRTMATRPIHLILLIIVTVTEVVLTFSIPWFAMRALSCKVDELYFEILALNAFATFGVSYILTPGNVGFVESMGAIAFSVAGAATVWSVLFWRFGVYYIYIIIGLIISVRDIIKRNIRRKKHRE